MVERPLSVLARWILILKATVRTKKHEAINRKDGGAEHWTIIADSLRGKLRHKACLFREEMRSWL